MEGLPRESPEASDAPRGQLQPIKRPEILKKIGGNGHEAELTSPSPELLMGAMVMYLDEIAGRMAEMQALFLSEIPEGRVKSIPWPVTERVDRIELPFDMITVTLINDGPDSLFWILHRQEEQAEWVELQLDESRTIDAKVPKIRDIWVHCDPGETAALRVEGKF